MHFTTKMRSDEGPRRDEIGAVRGLVVRFGAGLGLLLCESSVAVL